MLGHLLKQQKSEVSLGPASGIVMVASSPENMGHQVSSSLSKHGRDLSVKTVPSGKQVSGRLTEPGRSVNGELYYGVFQK